MKQLAALLLLFSAITVRGQITIGQAEMPHANDELIRTQAVTNPFINYAATGPAHTWTFTNLAANLGDTTNYQTVASTDFVYAIVYADLFFNPNRANHAKPGTDIPFSGLLPIEDPFTFRYRSNSVYKTVGFGLKLQGIPLPILFDEQDVIYQLPLNYGATSSSHSSYHIEVPNVGYYGFQQDRTNEVDGWGAITTPGGEFDVLRVKTTLTMRDSLFGLNINRPVVREYKWLAQGLRVPVLQINTTTVFGQEVATAIYYYDVPRSIEVIAPLASTICPGATLDLHYATTGHFNTGGFFVPANHFTAQLSDASGSFTSPVEIGDVTATESGTISVTIPANTPPAMGYRIRVISTSPDFVGTSNTFDITIGGTTMASISANGPTQLCTGQTLQLTAVGGPSYQWQLNGDDIPGATEATLEAVEAGAYTVVVDNACGSATSSSITVELNSPPVHEVPALEYTICAGSTAGMLVEDASGQTPLTYQWFLNDAPIVGATDLTLDASLAGAYTTEITNGTTGCTYLTPEVFVNVQSVDVPDVTVQGTTAFCAGSSLTLSVEAGAGITHQWLADGVELVGETGTELLVTSAGSYSVVATSDNGCASDTSAVTVITVFEVPTAPNVITAEPTTFCEGGGTTLVADALSDVTYQWLVNDEPIADATDLQITLTEAGAYTVMVTDTNGCSTVGTPTIEVVVNPLPAVPVIIGSNDSLLTSGTGSYQWFLEGAAIDGATEAWWIPTENGNYTVSVSDVNGCTSVSESWFFLTTGIGAAEASTWVISPNPNNGLFSLLVPSAQGQRFEVLDATGQRVRVARVQGQRTAVDMSSAAEGVYFVRLVNEPEAPVLRLVVGH